MLAAASRACLGARVGSFTKGVHSSRALRSLPLRARGGRTASSTPTAMAAKFGKNGERVYPEEGKVEVDGKFYRRCAAALVFNLNGDVLLGERLDRPGSWGMPQGGVEAEEDASAAAARELFEEVGMRVGETSGLEMVRSLPCEPSRAFVYPVDGGWLAEKGLAGQRLEFTLFHLPTAEDASGFVTLSGLAGEKAEFSRVRWATMAEAVEAVWGPKRAPYERCAELAAPVINAHLGRP